MFARGPDRWTGIACEASKYKTPTRSALCSNCPTSSSPQRGAQLLTSSFCNTGYARGRRGAGDGGAAPLLSFTILLQTYGLQFGSTTLPPSLFHALHFYALLSSHLLVHVDYSTVKSGLERHLPKSKIERLSNVATEAVQVARSQPLETLGKHTTGRVRILSEDSRNR
jgi:hypothetical protein